MSGTNYSQGGRWNFTRLTTVLNLRLVIFACIVGLGMLLVLWLQASVGRQMANLETKFNTLKAEAFYVGVQTRLKVRHLSEHFFGAHLNPNSIDLESFKLDAAELKAWLSQKEMALNTAKEHELLRQIEVAFDHHLTEMEKLLPKLDPGFKKADFAVIYEQHYQQTKPLLDLITDFVAAQQAAFNSFLQSSQATLFLLRRLLNLSLGLLLAAAITLAILVYRGMIAPLRSRLTESQEIIERQEKLAALGTLAAGVAHEIRNPLTAIKFRLFSFQKALPSEFADHEDATLISAEINRLDHIVKDFLQFARPAEPELARVPAERLLQEVSDLLRPELEKAGITLKLECPEPVWIQADTQQLKQVLINLVQNAADSVKQNGAIRLGLKSKTEFLNQQLQPVAVLQVVDTGKGIPPEAEKRLFDPFFSTKENGTGLGLAIAARIVEKHGGLLRYQTEWQRGTTFEIVLPRIEDHAT